MLLMLLVTKLIPSYISLLIISARHEHTSKFDGYDI
jgi:hypothetical protein